MRPYPSRETRPGAGNGGRGRSLRSRLCLLGLTTPFVVVLVLACRQEARPTGELVVGAAISLKAPLERIAAQYEQVSDAPRVRFTFGASGLLSTQIERGAPIDVFASASEALLDRLEGRELLLASSRHVLTGNELVVVASRASELVVDTLEGLTRAERLAIGNPNTVPAGQYARQCLEHFHLWDTLHDRLVLGEHARQVLDYAARGEVDASIVYATDAELLPEATHILLELPPDCHDAVLYGIAAMANTTRPEAARAFIARALSPESRRVFASYGFHSPLPPKP